MRQFDESKLANLHTASELLDKKYGKEGTASRAKFDKESHDYYQRIINKEPKNKKGTKA